MKPYLKWTALSVGSVVAIAHIGVLGHLIGRQSERIEVPTINIPRGTPYSSYKIQAGKDGYTIEYKANDPKVLESEKSIDLIKNQDKKGLFGGTKTFEDRNEYRRDQYTMEGVRLRRLEMMRNKIANEEIPSQEVINQRHEERLKKASKKLQKGNNRQEKARKQKRKYRKKD